MGMTLGKRFGKTLVEAKWDAEVESADDRVESRNDQFALPTMSGHWPLDWAAP